MILEPARNLRRLFRENPANGPLMNDEPRCPACGQALPANRLAGLCPACTWKSLSDFSPEDQEVETVASRQTAPSEPLLMRVPGYDIISEIARGGMGIVYRARALDPQRTVALKMLLPHQLGSAGMAERFRLEVRALTELEHPAILPVYHVGEHDGLPFFTMKLATGGTLAERKAEFAGDSRRIAELMVTLADAVQFAHEHGVLHRDLKPGNVLFDDAGRAYVSDFGLAKLASAQTGLTRSIDFLGTPHYVAPEIASSSAQRATTASDVYALGAILYELLSGKPPFEAEGIPALLKKIAEDEPAALSDAPRDLEVIALKCLSKEPSRRYASAAALADDLRAWLAGRPIAARPVSRAERTWKWVRRNPVLASLSAALALCLIGGGIALWHSNEQLRGALKSTRKAENLAQQNLRESLLTQSRALGAAHGTGQRWQALDALRRAAQIKPSLELRNEAAAALARPDLREVARFPATFGDAGSSFIFTSDLERYITPEPAGGFALRSTKDQRVIASFPGTLKRPARWFVLSPDDRSVAALLADYSLEVWRLDEKEPRARWKGTIQQPPTVEFSPDSASLAVYVQGQGVFLRDSAGTDHPLLQLTNSRAIFLRFDPSGERLAIVRDPGGVDVISCTGTPKVVWTQQMQHTVPWLSWTPDGGKLVAAADDGRGIRVLSASDGQIEVSFSSHLLYPRQFEVHPNGRTIASIGQDWVLRLWDARTGQELLSGVGRHRVVRFSRDGRRLSTAPTDRELAILELAPENVFREFRSSPASQGAGGGLNCSVDGKWLVTIQPQLRVYDTIRGEETASLNLPGTLKYCFFDTDGSGVFYSSHGRNICRRDLIPQDDGGSEGPAGPALRLGSEKVIASHPNAIIAGAVQSGRTWVRHGNDAIELWPDRDPAKAKRLGFRAVYERLAVSEDARWAAAPNFGKPRIEVWNCAANLAATNLPVRGPDRVWFSPDSRFLLASIENGYQMWETGTWKPAGRWEAHLDSGDPGEITFSADSKWLVARQQREVFRLFSFPDLRELVTLTPPLVLPVRNACLSPDGSRLWLFVAGYRIFEWNLSTLRHELAAMNLAWEQSN